MTHIGRPWSKKRALARVRESYIQVAFVSCPKSAGSPDLQMSKKRALARVREVDIQVAFVSWFRLTYPKILLCSSVAGVNVGAVAGRRIRDMGYSAGFPDLQIMCARNGFHGLFIELKTDIGRASKAQLEWISRLREEGYQAFVCAGLDAAMAVARNYMQAESQA